MGRHSEPFHPAKQAFHRMGKHLEQVFPLPRYVFQGEHYSGPVMRVLAKGVFGVVKFFFISIFVYLCGIIVICIIFER